MDKLKSVLYLIAIFVILIFMLPLLLLLSIYYILFCKEDKVVLNEAKKELAKFKRHYEEDESFRSQINEMSTFDKFNVYRCYMLIVNNKSKFNEDRSIRLIKKYGLCHMLCGSLKSNLSIMRSVQKHGFFGH